METKQSVLVENPLNGQMVDVMPFFKYLESIKENFHFDRKAEPNMISDSIDYITGNIIDFAQAIMDRLPEMAEIRPNEVNHLLEAIREANQLKKPFNEMRVNKDRYSLEEVENIIKKYQIAPPIPSFSTIINPVNGQRLKTEPLFKFLNRDGEETADVIEHVAQEAETKNPNSDLSNTTDLLRQFANCIREMAA